MQRDKPVHVAWVHVNKVLLYFELMMSLWRAFLDIRVYPHYGIWKEFWINRILFLPIFLVQPTYFCLFNFLLVLLYWLSYQSKFAQASAFSSKLLFGALTYVLFSFSCDRVVFSEQSAANSFRRTLFSPKMALTTAPKITRGFSERGVSPAGGTWKERSSPPLATPTTRSVSSARNAGKLSLVCYTFVFRWFIIRQLNNCMGNLNGLFFIVLLGQTGSIHLS